MSEQHGDDSPTDRPPPPPPPPPPPGPGRTPATHVPDPPPAPVPATGAPATTLAEPPPHPVPARRSRRPRWWAVLAVILLAVGTLGGGFLLGWTAQGRYLAGTPSVEPTVIEVAMPRYAGSADVLMPDLRGLDEQAAREVLGDVGIDPALVETSERPAAGTPGVVVEQTPAFGTQDPETVRLVLSAPAAVPEVVGRPLSQVQDELSLLGAQVEVVARYVAGTAAGTVVASVPASGQALSDFVTVEVAEAPSSVYLATLDSVEGGCSRGAAQVNGVAYASSVTCSGDSEGRSSSWLIDRVADRLQATVGVPDEDDPSTTLRVDVFADGVPVGGVDAGYGAPSTLDVPVTGALRLTITVRLTSGDDGSWTRGDVALGDARLVGGAETMAALGQ